MSSAGHRLARVIIYRMGLVDGLRLVGRWILDFLRRERFWVMIHDEKGASHLT
jgi:hypothetical protein